MTNFSEMRHQLLERLVAGEVDSEEYNWMLREIERNEQATHSELRQSFPETVPNGSPLAESHMQPGTVLGSYRIERMLGQGGMGEVWLAWEDVGEFYVVIKSLPQPVQSSQDLRKVFAIFHRVRLLQHQHICPVYTLGRHDHLGYYFVMKYVEGVTLDKHHEIHRQEHGRKLPQQQIVSILEAIAGALDYSHSRKVIHRDIKPQNVMVNEDGGDVQVVDFGLAAQIRTTMSVISGDSKLVSGTPPYMAPEQWTGELQDGRTDQYGLAAVAYELLGGQPPFAAPEFHIICHKAIHEEVPSIPTEPSAVNEVLRKALAKSRIDRFADCSTFVEALASVVEAGGPPR